MIQQHIVTIGLLTHLDLDALGYACIALYGNEKSNYIYKAVTARSSTLSALCVEYLLKNDSVNIFQLILQTNSKQTQRQNIYNIFHVCTDVSIVKFLIEYLNKMTFEQFENKIIDLFLIPDVNDNITLNNLIKAEFNSKKGLLLRSIYQRVTGRQLTLDYITEKKAMLMAKNDYVFRLTNSVYKSILVRNYVLTPGRFASLG